MTAQVDSAAWIVELLHGDSLGARMVINAASRRVLDEAEAKKGTPQFAGLIAATRFLGRLEDEIRALGNEFTDDESMVTPEKGRAGVCGKCRRFSESVRYLAEEKWLGNVCPSCDESMVTPGILAELEVSR